MSGSDPAPEGPHHEDTDPELYRALVETASDWLWEVDASGVFTYSNPRVKDILGYEPEEVIGKTLFDFMPSDEAARVGEELRELLRSQKPIHRLVNVNTHRNGSPVYLETSGVPFFDTEGDFAGYRGIDRDISIRSDLEASLLKSEHEKRTILDSLKELVVFTDTELRIIWLNKAACDSVNKTREELTGHRCHVVWGKSPEPCAECAVASAMQDRKTHVLEKRTPDGRTRLNRGYPVFDREGRVVGGIETSLDITDRIRSEAALRSSEERFRTVFESSPQGILLIDETGKIEDANPAICNMLGYEKEELVGLTAMGIIHPDDLQRAMTRGQAALHDPAKDNMRMEVRFLRKDGSAIWFDSNGAVLRDEDGQPQYAIAMLSDITDRKRAELALLEQASFRDAIIQKAEEGICVLRALPKPPFMEITVWNDKMVEITGYELEEVKGIDHIPLLFTDPEQQLSVRQNMGRMWGGEEALHRERDLTHKDGSKRTISASTSTLFSNDGRQHILIMSHDLTAERRAEEERRKLESQIQHTQKLESLGVLAGGIAHDFNNLLMSMLGNADLALMDLPKTSSARDRITGIETAARRAADLCRQMLAYSGKGRFVVEPLDLNSIIDELSRMLEVSISKRATLKCSHVEPLPLIQGDATQIRQVIMNLITNASEALEDKDGVISLTTGSMHCDRSYFSETYLDEHLAEGPYTFVEIADTGRGMDNDTKQRMFEPFFTTKFTGRGLGMAAVLGIVRGHRGAIRVYSEIGRGTTVKVLFPTIEQQDLAPPPSACPPVAPTRAGTILIADDEDSVREIATNMLERLGFAVLEAADGREAIEIYRTQKDKISCVLLDLTMPRMDGEEAFRELRMINPDVRVILSSGYNEMDVVQRFAGKGLTAFIQKPYQLATLRNTMNAVMDTDAHFC